MNCWHRPPKFLDMSCKKKGLHRICLFVFHSHDLTRTCFPGMYWVLPWECSRPKGVIIWSAIDRWSNCIHQDRDNPHLGTLSTIPQHFTHKQWNPVIHCCSPMSLCAAGCILQANLTSLDTWPSPVSPNRHSYNQKYKRFYFENNSTRRQK